VRSSAIRHPPSAIRHPPSAIRRPQLRAVERRWGSMQPFTKLRVWGEAHAWVLDVYKASRVFPSEERYCLTTQLRRAGISVPSNIAEGSKRRSALDFARHLNIAEGSLAESSYQLLLAEDLGYADLRALRARADEIGAMLHGFREKLERQGGR
jgi:four helix bundle protein